MSVRINKYLISVDDALGVSEINQLQSALQVSAADEFGLSDFQALLLKRYLIGISDEFAADENISLQSLQASLNIDVGDRLDFLEPQDEFTYTLSVFDALRASESASQRLPKYLLSADDQLAISENIAALMDKYHISSADAFRVSEGAEFHLKSFLSAADELGISESIAMVLARLLMAVSDSLAVSEDASGLLRSFLSAA